MREKIGILHPGKMGVFIARSAKINGNDVFWVSEGRSSATAERAFKHGISDAVSLSELIRECRIILSICPPHAAVDVAKQVIESSFDGIYADLNAISPQKALEISELMKENSVSFVDGGIIGGPAWNSGTTWLYLSGKQAPEVAGNFSEGSLRTKILGEKIGEASALKMCYAAYTKGRAALLCGILGVSESYNVRNALEGQWSLEDPGFSEKTGEMARRVTAKAWRFSGEMKEIASTFKNAGLPGGFHEAASEIYRRMSGFKDRDEMPELSEVLRALMGKK